MSSAAPAMSARAWGLLLALAALWAGSFFFAEVALRDLPPFTVVLARVGIAAVALALALRRLGLALPRDAATWRRFAGMAALNNALPFGFIVWGQTAIDGGLTAILNATTPLFAVLVAHVATADEKATPRRLAGVAVGLAGAVVVIGPDLLGGLGRHAVAEVAVVAGALSYAVAGVYGRRFRGQPPAVTAAGQAVTATLMLLPLALLAERPWTLPMPDAWTWAALAGLGVLSTALAYGIYFRLLALAGATNLLLVTLLIPVGALGLGALFLDEALHPRHLAGVALIAVGLAVLDGRLARPCSGQRWKTGPSSG